MESQNMSYGKCRCCQMNGYHQNIMKEYFRDGVKEVYFDMIMECFNVFLSTSADLTTLICLRCVERLRDANTFRSMVISTEQMLLGAVNGDGKDYIFVNVPGEENLLETELELELGIKSENGVSVKNEPLDALNKTDGDDNFDFGADLQDNKIIKLEEEQMQDSNDDDEIFHDDSAHNDEGEKLPDNVSPIQKLRIITLPSKQIVTNFHSNAKVIKPKIETQNFESEIPLAHLSKKNEHNINKISFVVLKKLRQEEVKEVKDCKVRRDVVQKGTSEKIDSKRETVSREAYVDNNNLRSNIALVLKNSTIIPFKYVHKREFVCLYCKKTFLFYEELKKHVESEHDHITENEIKKSVPAPKNLVKVDICDIRCKLCITQNRTETNENLANNGTQDKYETIESLVDHLVNVHKRVYNNSDFTPRHCLLAFDMSLDDIKCHICQKTFHLFIQLSVHMNEHFNHFICHICGKKFVSKQRLRNHDLNAHFKGSIKCRLCKMVFKTKPEKLDHIKQTHRTGKIKCLICDKTFNQYRQRKRHLEDEHNLKKPDFKCGFCFKQFATSSNLNEHVKFIHLRNKEYTCDHCGKSFSRKYLIASHMTLHTGVKKYKCTYCNKRFRLNNSLVLHVRGHLNVKPYACSLCDAAFIQKHCLTSHIRVHHPGADIGMGKGTLNKH